MRNDFQNVVSQGAATAKATYTQSSRQPETSVTYYGRGGGMFDRNSKISDFVLNISTFVSQKNSP